MRIRRTLAPLALAAALGACGDARDVEGAAPPPAPQAAGLRWPGPSYERVQAIFTARCLACHSDPSPLGVFSLAAPGSWANLVGIAAEAPALPGTLVVPNDSASSVLHQRLTGGPSILMPQGGPRIPAEEIETVRAWIDEGGARQDLAVSFSGMDPHVGELLVLRLEGDSGRLRTRVVLDPVPEASFEIFAPRVLPAGSHTVSFWADEDRDGAYDAPPVDHAWTRPVPASGRVTFARDTAFADVGETAPGGEPGQDFTLALSGMEPHVGQALTVAVYARGSAPTDLALVGLHRRGAVPLPSFSITIPGIVEPLARYYVDVHADANRNGRYDAPPADAAWRIVGSAGAAGLSVSFARDGNVTDVSGYPLP